MAHPAFPARGFAVAMLTTLPIALAISDPPAVEYRTLIASVAYTSPASLYLQATDVSTNLAHDVAGSGSRLAHETRGMLHA